MDVKPEPQPEIRPEPITTEAMRPTPPPPKPAAKAKPVAPVIPLVHAPDDPGLDSGLDIEPTPETVSPPSGDAWHRIRQLFR